jgi:hypothetical protein
MLRGSGGTADDGASAGGACRGQRARARRRPEGRPDFGTPSTDMSIPAVAARSGDYPEVDVAIVMESTYPYLATSTSG